MKTKNEEKKSKKILSVSELLQVRGGIDPIKVTVPK